MSKPDMKTQFLRKVKITNEMNVELTFTEKATLNAIDDKGDEQFVNNEYSGKFKYKPVDDFINALRNLRKHAVVLLEMKMTKPELKNYTVNELRISGSVEQKNARCSMVLIKKLKRSSKPAEFKVPEVSMFDPNEYADCDELVKDVKIVTKEVFAYLGGKCVEEEQLSLFQKP